MSLVSRRRVWTEFADLLEKTAEERGQRREFVRRGTEVMPLWVVYERTVMHDHVNLLRQQAGKPPVSLDEVARVEQGACGHVDYAKKYALGCERLVAQP